MPLPAVPAHPIVSDLLKMHDTNTLHKKVITTDPVPPALATYTNHHCVFPPVNSTIARGDGLKAYSEDTDEHRIYTKQPKQISSSL
jgi:hypothetical protein